MPDALTPSARIEEAHGLWELAVARVAAMAEVNASPIILAEAVKDERAAFRHWQDVSREAMAAQ